MFPSVPIRRTWWIFSPPRRAVESRPVLMYISGRRRLTKIEQQDREANAFYDNIMRWATQNGMVGVNMQRHPGPDWDSGGKDVSLMIQWVEANIGKYKGNPDRMFIWAQSAGKRMARSASTSDVPSFGDRRASASRARSSCRASSISSAGGARCRQVRRQVGAAVSIFSPGLVQHAWPSGRGGILEQRRDCRTGAARTILPHEVAGAVAGAALAVVRRSIPRLQLARSSLPALKTSTVKIMLCHRARLDHRDQWSRQRVQQGFA